MDTPNVTVIRPKSNGLKLPEFNMPKVNPKFLVGTTLVLAVFSIMGAGLLYYQNKSQAPTKTSAATTITLADNFGSANLDTSKWNAFTASPQSSVVQTSGVINIVSTQSTTTNQNSGIASTQLITGDFSAEISASNLQSSSISNGSAEISLSGSTSGTWISLAWRKNNLGSYVDINSTSSNGGQNIVNGNYSVGSTTNLKLRIVRVGSVAQGYVDTGNGYQLAGSIPNAYSGDGRIHISVFDFSNTANNMTSATFDNFSAQVNLLGAATPAPGTSAACSTQFTVLALVPTPTPTTSSSPTPTPTPVGASPTTTPRPTPTPTPVTGCNYTCVANTDCPSDLICYSGFCRNPQCSNATNCSCSQPTPTPTPTPTPAPFCNTSCTGNTDCPSSMICYSGSCRNPSCVTSTSCACTVAGPTPTPATNLTQAGSVAGTWTISIAGLIMVGLGTLMLAF